MSDSKYQPDPQSKNKSYSSVETQRELRIERMEDLKKLGVDPFTPDSQRDYILKNVKNDFENLKGKQVTLAGRLKNKRTSGKIAFATVEDESLPEGFQFVFKKDDLPSQGFWSLHFKTEDVLPKILDGSKTVEIRALNLEVKEEGRYYGDIQPSDTISLVDTINNKLYLYRALEVARFESLDDAWVSGLDFKAVSGGTEYASVSDLKKEYSDTLSPQYLNKMQTNGLIALTLEKMTDGETHQLNFDNFKKLIDEGDYIQATGVLDYSQSGEPSLFVAEYKILTKALRPLPEELEYENIEGRYLDRVADFKKNTKDEAGLGVRDMIKLKSKYWSIWREEMIKEGFLEVETPTLELIPGGAEAKPFTTFYNELEQDVYLRIAPELSLKKLIAGGFESVFEIGKNFRNEGSSPQHLQEFTAIEWYKSYEDYNYAMLLTKRIYQQIVLEIIGSYEQIDYYGHSIDWGDWCTQEMAQRRGWDLLGGWPKIKYFDAVRYFSEGKVDTEFKTPEELVAIGTQLGILDLSVELGMGTLLDKIWKKIRVHTTNPFFLYLPPVELEPLAKRHTAQTNLTERFQVVAGSAELGKGFTELNDPIDQFGRFEEQQKARDSGNEEAQFMDPLYVKALEYGTPPMTGFGTSERFFSFLLSKNIKEAVTFPAVKSDNQETQKSKKTQVAHAVLLNTPDIPNWSKLNAAAHLAASFGAREGKKLIWISESQTLDGQSIPMNIQHAIVMKEASSPLDLLDLKEKAEKKGLVVSCFTEEMRDSTNDQAVANSQSRKSSMDIGWLGILVFGKKSDVEEITDGFERMS